MDTNMSKQLDSLREKYRKGIVSVIVGAGFSRNACEAYPSWKDLLYDMVIELYEDDIENGYIRYCKINSKKKISLEEYKEKEVPEIIERVGYLKMVSEYIARKGYREAIEHYIEERIPYIDTNTRQFKFAGKNKSRLVDIDAEKFSAHKKLLEGEKWERIYTTNYDRLLEYVVDICEKKYSVIKKAKELSVSRDEPSIIKLHGDLYDPKEKRMFMFDGNPHQQYIISEEDYKNYPKDHEAFTQLMRISLLQGAFCLIGFSGDDPNFINWISWVRDVIVKDEGSGDVNTVEVENTHKIFLIGLTKDEPDDVRKIFYDNHNIVYVPLLSNDVKEVINAKGIDEPRDLFCKFFEFLYEVSLSEDVMNGDDDTPNRKEYNELWDNVYVVDHKEINDKKIEFDITIDDEKLERLYALKPWNRIVTYTYRQTFFLDKIDWKEKLTVAEAKLALLAMADTGCLVNDDFIKKISESGIGTDLMDRLGQCIERTKTLTNYSFDNETAEEPETYELILRNLFTLNFKKVHEMLDGWNPSGTDVVKKAVLISYFDKSVAKDLLVDYIKREPNVKEQYYATRMLNLFEETFPLAHSLDRFENANVQDYYKVMSTLIKRINDKKEKIRRYGDGKKEKIHYFGIEPTKFWDAVALIHFMIEAPAFVSYKNYRSLLNSEEWYNVHKKSFEHIPLPVLYFGLQCTDDKVKTRIGQDYSYSDRLAQTCLADILKYLLTAYLAEETPNYIKESILIISKELFVSVKPSEWEGLFIRIWNDVVIKFRFVNDNDRRYEYLDLFVYKALGCMKTLACRQLIICDVLARAKISIGFAINCLYYLQISSSDIKCNQELQTAVNVFINGITAPLELNVVGNIYNLLTKEQKKQCKNKCIELLSDKNNIIENNVYHVSQFFIKDNAEGQEVFIKSICDNPLLWSNGITGQNTYSDFTYLKLSKLIRRFKVGQASLVVIFNKLKKSAEDLISYFDRYGYYFFSFGTDGLLLEMITFLNHYEKRLKNEDGYYVMCERVSDAYHKYSGLYSVEDGLLSEYEDDVVKSLKYIEANQYALTHKELIRFIDIIINRLLLKNSDGLDYCIEYLRSFINKRLIKLKDEELISGIVRILDRYKKDDVLKCNMDLVRTSLHMGKIAMFLSNKGLSSKGIDYWKHFKKTSRFYCNFN